MCFFVRDSWTDIDLTTARIEWKGEYIWSVGFVSVGFVELLRPGGSDENERQVIGFTENVVFDLLIVERRIVLGGMCKCER